MTPFVVYVCLGIVYLVLGIIRDPKRSGAIAASLAAFVGLAAIAGFKTTPQGAAWLGSWMLLCALIASRGNPAMLLLGFGDGEKTRDITVTPGGEGSEYAKAKLRARELRDKGDRVRGLMVALFIAGVLLLLVVWREFFSMYLTTRGG